MTLGFDARHAGDPDAPSTGLLANRLDSKND